MRNIFTQQKIVEELIADRDGLVRVVKLQAGENYLKRSVQHLYPLQLSCDRTDETLKAAPNAEEPAFRPKRDAAIVARVCIQDLAEDGQEH